MQKLPRLLFDFKVLTISQLLTIFSRVTRVPDLTMAHAMDDKTLKHSVDTNVCTDCVCLTLFFGCHFQLLNTITLSNLVNPVPGSIYTHVISK